jgi:polyisoprenyl-teichoic acid--peptidoglycan teichoic acid transferase
MSLIPRSRAGALWRFLFAGVLVIGLAAATTAVAGLLQVKTIVTDLNQTPALKHAEVVLPSPGAPETLLLIGSDHRAGDTYRDANTDTMMLVRIDDSSSTINLLSIPRDLAVELPSGGVEAQQKLNAAYSIGGPNLLITTLKDQVFPGLVVNHIIDINFAGFSDLIDAIGCVYADVDHRYYNNTEQTDYSSIFIQPGYQKLCGDNQSPSGALAFVRFRHTDSDIVRNARQQDFLRWAKDGYNTSQLLANEGRLLKIFGANVQTDHFLHTTDGLIDLFDLAINADGHTLKTIQFPEYFGPCGGNAQTPCFVFPTSEAAEEQAYQEFMTPTAAPPSSSAASTVGKRGRHKRTLSQIPTAGLASDPGDGRSQAAQLHRAGMPVYYPRLIAAGSDYCFSITGNCDELPNPASAYVGSYPRAYMIHTQDGTPEDAYVFTLVLNAELGEYYTVQGTTWQHAPILGEPSKVQVVARKKLFEYTDGGKLALVAWHTSQGVYWISNTLSNTIPNSQMIGMAASFTRAP